MRMSIVPRIAVAIDSLQLSRRSQVAGGGQVYAHGLWMVNWADTHRQIEAVDSFAGNHSIARLARAFMPVGKTVRLKTTSVMVTR